MPNAPRFGDGEMNATIELVISVDLGIVEKARDASAATGIMLREITERGLVGEVKRLEAEFGRPFPQRANRRLKTGPAPGGRRAPMK
jgi:hypothetical protein